MTVLFAVIAAALAVALVVLVRAVRRAAVVAARVEHRLGGVPSGGETTSVAAVHDTLQRVDVKVQRLVDVEQAESLSQARLRLTFDGITQGIVVCDAAGDIVVRNSYAETFVQARHGEALVSGALNELLAAALRGEAGEQEVEIFGPPARSYFVHAEPISDGENLLGALAVIEDTTEIQRIDSVRRDFVSNLSHEVKTPIGALSLLAETLTDEDDIETIQRLSGRIQHEVERLGRMVDDLLVLSRIEQAGMVELGKFDADRVVREALERVRGTLDLRQVDIDTIDVPSGIDLTGDRRQLISAVANLIDNAVKYSDEGAQVEVRVAADDHTVSFVVQDHGIGIPLRDLDRIFERFYRVDRARSRATGGTGLGLSIVRHVAANHGGEVRVESREGQGSTFTLLVPRHQSQITTEVPV